MVEANIYKNMSLKELKQVKKNIYKDDVIKISYIDNNSDSVVIVFAYGIRPPVKSLIKFPSNEDYRHGINIVNNGPDRFVLTSFIWNNEKSARSGI